MQQDDYGPDYYPNLAEINDFASWCHHSPEYDAEKLQRVKTWRAGKKKEYGLIGTSFSAPHAGAMIMATLQNDGTKTENTQKQPFDIIPAALMAAQENPPQTKTSIINAAGLKFDPEQYGFGYLEKHHLKKYMDQLTNLKRSAPENSSNICRNLSSRFNIASGNETKPPIIYVTMPDHASGDVLVNTCLTVNFNNKAGNSFDNEKAERSVPNTVKVTSPSGTCFSLPLLINREDEYGDTIGAAMQTHGFFGETGGNGKWKIEIPDHRYTPVSAQIITFGLSSKSAGAKLLKRHIAP